MRLRAASLTGALGATATDVRVDRPAAAWLASGRERTGTVRLGATRVFAPRTRTVPAPAAANPRLRVLELAGALVEHDPPTLVGPVGASQAADALLEYLGRHGHVEPHVDLEPHTAAGRDPAREERA